MTDIGPITHLEIGGQDVTAYIHTEPWTLEHEVRVFRQNEVRPGPPDSGGQRWVERRLTGKANVVCNCGYTTGWIPREQLPDIEQLKAEHPRYLGGQGVAAAYPEERTRESTVTWLRANNIDPNDVPLDSDITIHTGEAGTRFIRYTALHRGEHGRPYLGPDGHASTETRDVPLLVERP